MGGNARNALRSIGREERHVFRADSHEETIA